MNFQFNELVFSVIAMAFVATASSSATTIDADADWSPTVNPSPTGWYYAYRDGETRDGNYTQMGFQDPGNGDYTAWRKNFSSPWIAQVTTSFASFTPGLYMQPGDTSGNPSIPGIAAIRYLVPAGVTQVGVNYGFTMNDPAGEVIWAVEVDHPLGGGLFSVDTIATGHVGAGQATEATGSPTGISVLPGDYVTFLTSDDGNVGNDTVQVLQAQVVTPEPGTALLLGLSAIVLASRHRARLISA